MLKLEDLKGIHKGKRAFLVGNGPSLASAPFDLLANEHTFGMNRIAMLFKDTDWRPTYFVGVSSLMVDTSLSHYHEDYLEGIGTAWIAFVWSGLARRSMFNRRTNVVFVDCSELEDIEAQDASVDFWSDDITERVSKFGTSMFAALQIAAWMGFDPLYLVGVDGFYQDYKGADDPNHFTREYRGKHGSTDFTKVNKAHRKAFEIAKEAARVKIYDATQAPGHGIFPKRDLLKVLDG
ncbi:MAG: hypothetical protein ACYSUC_07475 [Planctomycetota bacterium]|jgi:hypothetical protein